MGRALIALPLLALVGFGGWRYERTRSLEHRLAAVASQIARRPVKVHCQGTVAATVDVGAELGKVQFDGAGKPADTTDLTHGVCGWLSVEQYAIPRLSEILDDSSGTSSRAHPHVVADLHVLLLRNRCLS